jgi:biotin carboxylase
MSKPLSILCIASFFKGNDFMIAAKSIGCTVYLLTSQKHQDKAWPHASIDEIFYVPEDALNNWNMSHVIGGLAHAMQSRKIDRMVSLDDFDVEKGSELREHFRIPGMGQTTGRHFRDKLAMRVKAAEAGIPVPPFCALFNDAEINEFAQKTPTPWLVKPRGEASATGIKKVHSAEELWQHIHSLGERRHNFLVEQFKPGDVYHVDALSNEGKVLFARSSKYVNTPFEVAHGGGIFRSATVDFDGEEDQMLQKWNAVVMEAFGMKYSASHTEFIRAHEDGQFYFLETASRVGGANIAEMVEFSSNINLWGEWARVEAAVARGEKYQLPKVKNDHAGVIISLARTQKADYTNFPETEIVWKMELDHHIGMIVRAKTRERVLELLDVFAQRIQQDFHASVPIGDKPSN